MGEQEEDDDEEEGNKDEEKELTEEEEDKMKEEKEKERRRRTGGSKQSSEEIIKTSKTFKKLGRKIWRLYRDRGETKIKELRRRPGVQSQVYKTQMRPKEGLTGGGKGGRSGR